MNGVVRDVVALLVSGGALVGVLGWLFARFVAMNDAAVGEVKALCREMGAGHSRDVADLRGQTEEALREALAAVSALREQMRDSEARMIERYVTRHEWQETTRQLDKIDGKLDELIRALLHRRSGEAS